MIFGETEMATVGELVAHFSEGVKEPVHPTVGLEVETFFVCRDGRPITLEQSQDLFRKLTRQGWQIVQQKGELIAKLSRGDDVICYETSWPNIELATGPRSFDPAGYARSVLASIYATAGLVKAYPRFEPVYQSCGDYLVIADDRDMTWVMLDGREAFAPIGRISSVQFVFAVSPRQAIQLLNRLGRQLGIFLAVYAQEEIWRRYIAESKAGYRQDRYGGPCAFASLDHYCSELAKHAVVTEGKLVPFSEADLSTPSKIDLFLRSVWLYFRLRRHGNQLCIEVRPWPRKNDRHIDDQLHATRSFMGL